MNNTPTSTDTRRGLSSRARAEIDLDALRANVTSLRARTGRAALMAVVKSDGYGHGALPCAKAALEAGATWVATATPEEALALRAAGLDAPLMCWLWTPGGPWREGIEAGLDMSVSGMWALAEVTAAAREAGRPARIQLKADTGLGRNGCQPADWAELVAAARAAEAEGAVRVTGVWSHFARADEPGHPSVQQQLDTFGDMLAHAEGEGIDPEVRHIANSPATLTLPASHFDLVRTGIAMYGISPSPEVGTHRELGLRPVMTLSANVALVKGVPAGHGVSYGHTYVTAEETTLGLIPVGYADGIPRHASGRGPVLVAGERHTIAGRVAMDQFVVDLGGRKVQEGAEAVLFGPGDHGEPTAEDWARAADTIAYEIVTRIGQRVPRIHLGATEEHGSGDGPAQPA
ncbi:MULTISPECIES: alanine racemase [Streptomyces]|uniref:Alanine racemase n=1 Tax=Streptomyces tsukubensis (strain DSM 42081 / NBRC 108919 / NRRL 18488 / 9993) TaxID=1114943 RepID=I2N4J7_STRT9|nr:MULTISPECIES: alanine racemase [Streptomyces]AZK96001.1 alanine racemase [Streptomyces tsukubensis]EIF91944.1 alanine racemase [Streptomyces tsukubensis NRRL18488]MYS65039.1 alanine racemase [Streptomyces sp. SID5473]QKM67979.1 alanine racemase [Streptomyces tsukubensis NRRL18488]TAI44378.1 alanine racemase [Streptomyces tsukubensis]